MAPALRLGFHERVTEVRVTSVTSGFEGALGIRFGSVGLCGWIGEPNSKYRKKEFRKNEAVLTRKHLLLKSNFFLSVTLTLDFYKGLPGGLSTGCGGNAGVSTSVTKLEDGWNIFG